jgi:phage shock protein E
MKARKTNTAPTYLGQPVDAVIDVRSHLEFWLGHLDGAICIPVDVIGQKLPERSAIGKDARILLYCASGARSAAAAAQLRSLGYQDITDGGAISSAATKYSP